MARNPLGCARRAPSRDLTNRSCPMLTHLTLNRLDIGDGLPGFRVELAHHQSKTFHFKLKGTAAMPDDSAAAVYVFLDDMCIAPLLSRRQPSGIFGQLASLGDTKPTRSFEGWVNVSLAPPRFSLSVFAGPSGLFQTGQNKIAHDRIDQCVQVATIDGERRPLDTGYEMQFQPLVLNCLGRSGSSYAMALLSAHPELAAIRRHPYEFAVAREYLRRAIRSSLPCDDTFDLDLDRDRTRPAHAWYNYDRTNWMHLPDGEDHFALDQVLRYFRFAQESIDDFYRRVVGSGKQQTFVEKNGDDIFVHDQMRLLHPQSKRIFLIRDFRDTTASVLRFDSRKPEESGSKGGFGRRYAHGEDAWIASQARRAARLAQIYRQRDPGDVFLFYEQLISDPRPTISAVLEELGLDAREPTVSSMLAAARRKDERTHMTSESAASSVGSWQNGIPQSAVELIQTAFDDSLTAFGYH